MTQQQNGKTVRAATGQEMAAVLLAQLEREADLVAENNKLRGMVEAQRRKIFHTQDQLHQIRTSHSERTSWLCIQHTTNDSTHISLHYLPGIVFIDVYRNGTKIRQDVVDLTEDTELSDLFDGTGWYLPRVVELIQSVVDGVQVAGITDAGKKALQEETAEGDDLPPFIEKNY